MRVPVSSVEVREWREADASAMVRALEASREHLRPWMAWVADEESFDEDARRRWIRERIAEREAGGDLLAGFFVNGGIAGAGGLHRRIGPNGLEIGYWVHRDWLRRGVATAGVHRLVAMAFADPAIDHVEIHHDAANVASGRVAQRAGFTLAGEHPRAPAAPAEQGLERVWRLRREAS